MARNNFNFDKSFYTALEELSDEEKTQVILKIMKYQFEEDQGKEIELTGISKAIFELIKLQLDRDNLAYENGKKGGRPKQEKTTLLTTLSEEKEEKEKEKNQKKKNKEERDIYTHEDEKVHFAEFVAMTNAEYQKLVSTYGKEFADQCIEVLDNYKGATGKKYKNDYRAILNWVVDRVRQNNSSNRSTAKTKEELELEAIYERL